MTTTTGKCGCGCCGPVDDVAEPETSHARKREELEAAHREGELRVAEFERRLAELERALGRPAVP